MRDRRSPGTQRGYTLPYTAAGGGALEACEPHARFHNAHPRPHEPASGHGTLGLVGGLPWDWVLTHSVSLSQPATPRHHPNVCTRSASVGLVGDPSRVAVDQRSPTLGMGGHPVAPHPTRLRDAEWSVPTAVGSPHAPHPHFPLLLPCFPRLSVDSRQGCSLFLRSKRPAAPRVPYWYVQSA